MQEMIDRASIIPEGAAEVHYEDEDSAYVDRRWRRIELLSHGHSWTARLEKLAQEAQDRSDLGLILWPQLP